MARAGREAGSAGGITNILKDLEKGDKIVFSTSSWQRKRPLTVKHTRSEYVVVESNRGREYDIVWAREATRGANPIVPDEGPVVHIKVVG